MEILGNMELNKVHNMDFLDNTLPDKCAQLIIADPPYYKVKGDFDFVWKTFEDYLTDVEKWAKECKRLLADNGTLFWWGHARNIAYSQIVLDKYFTLLNSLVWKKKECQTKRTNIDEFRAFIPITERVLMYSHVNDCADGFEPSYIRDYFQQYLMGEKNKAGINDNDINRICGYSPKTANKIINKQKNWNFITKESYIKLQKYTGCFKIPYDSLRIKYEELRRYFDNPNKLEDVLEFSQESHITANYDHETKKPETLTRSLILTTSRPNDLVLVPFAGSGTECAMSIKEGRRCIGFDIENKYVEMSNRRIRTHQMQQKLF
jgi:DNA modification methylase